MKVYLDLCCLKRPFDSKEQARVRLEAEAVLALLAAPGLELVRSGVQVVENECNPVAWRREAVARWLGEEALAAVDRASLAERTFQLTGHGFAAFDAAHLATAELTGADVFVTCDARLLRQAASAPFALRVRVVEPVDLVREVAPWSS